MNKKEFKCFRCHKCNLAIDDRNVYVKVYDKEELLYHLECFHKDYSPLEEKNKG